MENRNLKLVLTYKWYDMIESGVKKEEYRSIKESVVSLLFNWWKSGLTREQFTQKIIDDGHFGNVDQYRKLFDYIEFYRGYGKNRMTMIVEFKELRVGTPVLEWSDGWNAKDSEWNKNVFAFKLGKIISKEQEEKHTFDEWMELTRKNKFK
jgi:hypothetical protein